MIRRLDEIAFILDDGNFTDVYGTVPVVSAAGGRSASGAGLVLPQGVVQTSARIAVAALGLSAGEPE